MININDTCKYNQWNIQIEDRADGFRNFHLQ